MATEPPVTPLNLCENASEGQKAQLQKLLQEAAQTACQKALGRLDRNCVQAALETCQTLQSEIADALAEIVQRHTVSDKYKNEEVKSDRSYPPAYRVLPVEAQVAELRRLFPSLGGCLVKLARRPLLEGAEAWFAIPRWQALAPSYNEAVEMALAALATKRKFQNRIAGRLGPEHLRQSDRTKMAETVLAEQQQGQDILLVPAQAGLLHRGCSPRRFRLRMAGNEFGAGILAVACMLIVHPERLSREDALMVDCAGDEYSIGGNSLYDRAPLFDYDISGIDLSIFYEDQARNRWGAPSGFLYKFS